MENYRLKVRYKAFYIYTLLTYLLTYTIVDILQKGKELNKELRRNQVKKKLGRVEEKLNELKSKAESQGLL